MIKEENKRKKLDFKCGNCKQRYSINELENLGYVDKIDGYISVECPKCEDKVLLKK